MDCGQPLPIQHSCCFHEFGRTPVPSNGLLQKKTVLTDMGNEMVRSGIALFIAAGNNGVSAQIGTPGSAEDVITVGALDKNSAIAIYSSQGPTEEGAREAKHSLCWLKRHVCGLQYRRPIY
jgi:hypothetical protein